MVMVANKLTYTKLNVELMLTIVTVKFKAMQVLFLMQQGRVENKRMLAVFLFHFPFIFVISGKDSSSGMHL